MKRFSVGDIDVYSRSELVGRYSRLEHVAWVWNEFPSTWLLPWRFAYRHLHALRARYHWPHFNTRWHTMWVALVLALAHMLETRLRRQAATLSTLFHTSVPSYKMISAPQVCIRCMFSCMAKLTGYGIIYMDDAPRRLFWIAFMYAYAFIRKGIVDRLYAPCPSETNGFRKTACPTCYCWSMNVDNWTHNNR